MHTPNEFNPLGAAARIDPLSQLDWLRQKYPELGYIFDLVEDQAEKLSNSVLQAEHDDLKDIYEDREWKLTRVEDLCLDAENAVNLRRQTPREALNELIALIRSL